MKKDKLVLIDGHSILNRAFYGIPDLTNSFGLHTNAVYGFLNIMFKILDEEQANYLVVAFDVKGPTFRHEIYQAYKGTRKPSPTEFVEQVPVIKELLQAMGIKIMEKQGLEGDDILGTLAKRAEAEGMDVALISGDRDLLQIATDHIKVRIPRTRGGKTEVEDYFAKDVIEHYQVSPTQFIDIKALMGDSSDNIPGVPKIGEKTAVELIVTYGTIENLKEHIQEIKKKSIRESLEENFELAELSKVLATINTNADIICDFKQTKLENVYTKQAYAIMKKLEFKNLLSRFENDIMVKNIQTEQFKMVTDLDETEKVFKEAGNASCVGFRFIGGDELLGLAIAYSETDCYFIAVQGFVSKDYLLDKMNYLMQSAEHTVFSVFDLKGALPHILSVSNSMTDIQTEIMAKRLVGKCFDTSIAAYLLNPLKNDYDNEDIANEHLGLMIPNKAEVFGKLSLEEVYEKAPLEFLEYVCFQAYVSYKAYEVLYKKLVDANMLALFEEIEMPLCLCLYDMEADGIMVRPNELEQYGRELGEHIERLEYTIHEQAGVDFNINSPKQLGEVLFEKMGIPVGKKKKSGYSTAADVLEKLAEEYPFVSDILEYRGLTKLKSTYADGLANYIDKNNRIHSHFNQTITATGRISSTEPNLQNIPVRMEQGRLIRKVFVPKEGCIFVDADYSQIELRILAHMSGDKKLIEAYNREQDIHRITASEVFHIPFEEVTSIQRRNAKAVNFGIVYGISSFGLSQGLSISRKEAKEYIDKYFDTYPQVKVFLDQLVADAKEKGYVTTMFGRRRPVPELQSGNFMQRNFGERVAMNAPIQGTAADIMKVAMIRVHDRLQEENLKSRLLLQVHDELLVEAYEEEVEAVKIIVSEEMKAAAKLSIKLEIDMSTGTNWYEAK